MAINDSLISRQIKVYQSIPAQSIITITPGSGATVTVEYSVSNTPAVNNNVAVWSKWSKGVLATAVAVSDLTQALYHLRVTTNGGSCKVFVNEKPTDADKAPFKTTDFNAQIDARGLAVTAVGAGLLVKEGTNAKQGLASALVAGVVTVANTSVTTTSRIFVQRQTDGGTVGASYSITRTAGTSFTITAKDGAGATQTLDTSTLAYQIFEPA